VYPLASSPTPSTLRNIKFELGGKPVVFSEPDDTAGTLAEVRKIKFHPFKDTCQVETNTAF
jgi:F-box and WD-40 domain protein CDC4